MTVLPESRSDDADNDDDDDDVGLCLSVSEDIVNSVHHDRLVCVSQTTNTNM